MSAPGSLFLMCQDCNEVFDDIEIARAHQEEEVKEYGTGWSHPGFDLMTESEAW